jgi:D-alanine-D-alanine ligase
LRVGVLFGGKTGEHEVSVMSAQSVLRALNPDKYEVVPIGISKSGNFIPGPQAMKSLEDGCVQDNDSIAAFTIPDTMSDTIPDMKSNFPVLSDITRAGKLDVVFPVLHGSFGEDGTIQGLLELASLPYVGSGVLASAVCMDKIMMKKLFQAHGFPQVRFESLTRRQVETDVSEVIAHIERTIGYPCFVKPANLGSSVGISKANSRDTLKTALSDAAQYDRRLLVEEGLDVREIEIGVLGNDYPKVSVPGEIIPSGEFYDYRAKYISGDSALMIPAVVSEEQRKEIADLAIRAYLAADCAGLARIDFFVERSTGRVLLNEINTMPGFTEYSMYPKLWETTGLSYAQLVEELIQCALERHEEVRRNVTEFQIPES